MANKEVKMNIMRCIEQLHKLVSTREMNSNVTELNSSWVAHESCFV